MKTQSIKMPVQMPAISFTAKSDIALKIVLFAAILTCINIVAVI